MLISFLFSCTLPTIWQLRPSLLRISKHTFAIWQKMENTCLVKNSRFEFFFLIGYKNIFLKRFGSLSIYINKKKKITQGSVARSWISLKWTPSVQIKLSVLDWGGQYFWELLEPPGNGDFTPWKTSWKMQ